ncbi:hypothetical protein D3C85_1762780 [compost metagenome]
MWKIQHAGAQLHAPGHRNQAGQKLQGIGNRLGALRGVLTDPQLIETDAVGMDGAGNILVIHLVIVPALVM